MDLSPKLSGETLVVHHIPLVHCQVSGGRAPGSGGSLKRSNPFSSSSENLGLSRTASLPERDILQKEALLFGGLLHTSSAGRAREASGERGGGGGDASPDAQDHLLIAHTLPRAKACSRNPLRHNPFLLNTEPCEEEEEEEEEEEDGDNLYGYLEDSSFHLQGRPSATARLQDAPFRLHEVELGSEPLALHGALGSKWGSLGEESQESLRGGSWGLSDQLDDLRRLGLGGQRRHGSSGSNMSMDCVDPDWAEDLEDQEDQPMGCGRSGKTLSSCSSHDYREHFLHSFPEAFSEAGQEGYGSDSSCNSSDGVLVNFSAIYNKMSKPTNLNYSRDHSRTSSFSPGSQRNPTGGAFYLDLQSSPTEPLQSHQQNSFLGHHPFPAVHNCHPSTSSTGSSSTQEGHDLDANCNSCHPLRSGSSGDFASCLQSQARLVVATQNYYKLVTCDLSSQSSPSPAGSSATSGSEEPSKGSPTPNHPREYFLFRPGEDAPAASLGPNEELDDRRRTQGQCAAAGIQGQVYVNSLEGKPSGEGRRLRSRSYDRNLDQVPPPRQGSLERMFSCPMRLSDTLLSPPPRVTSFAEIARSKRRSGGGAGPEAAFSLENLPLEEQQGPGVSRGPGPPAGCCSLEPCTPHRTEPHAPGGLCVSGDTMETVRYSKDQRPTTLPIQPFSFQHPLGARPPPPKPQRPLLPGGEASGVQFRGPTGPLGGEEGQSPQNSPGHQGGRRGPPGGPPPPECVRPSPLGSYSPVRQQGGALSSGTCSTCTPSPRSACSHSCALSPGPGLMHMMPSGPLRQASAPAAAGGGGGDTPPALSPVQGPCYQGAGPGMPRDMLDSLGGLDSSRPPDGAPCSGGRPYNAGGHSYSELLLDYFSLTEKPPEEFCLSPDSSASPRPPVDLSHKTGLVKAVNTAVDLIVAHFGTSRDPEVKAKLGNSWVSPNVGHLILKYLCPALREVLQDGLKAHLLDLIVGQRPCQPWSLVEASTQLGPSTRLLHTLFSKVSQFSELSSHRMRLNAFIFGLLNLRSLEFWLNHVYTHEDIVGAHYEQQGLLALALQGAARPLFQELLLLLQPLSLLPFDLDVLFEAHLLQKDQEQLLRKLQLCSVDQSTRSTFQLMRGWGAAVTQSLKESGEARKERPGLRREVTLPRMEGAGRRMEGTGRRMEGAGCSSEGPGCRVEGAGCRVEGAGCRVEGAGCRADGGNSVCAATGLVSKQTAKESSLLPPRGMSDLCTERGMGCHRMKGVGEESHGEEGGGRDRNKERERDLDRQAGWWYQLMQSSQVYIDQSAEGSKFIKTEKKRKSSERRQPPPTREGVVEGAESKQEMEGHTGRRSLSAMAESRCRPSWMGSPPESVLSAAPQDTGPRSEGQAAAAPAESPLWGRLFGSVLGSPSTKQGAPQRARKSRPPSGWLGLDRSVLDLMILTIGSGTGPKGSVPLPNQSRALSQAPASLPRSPCEVLALCHHIATEPGHLSFHKGDVLKVLNKTNPDWLLCSLGRCQGLVPIMYVTLKHDDN